MKKSWLAETVLEHWLEHWLNKWEILLFAITMRFVTENNMKSWVGWKVARKACESDSSFTEPFLRWLKTNYYSFQIERYLSLSYVLWWYIQSLIGSHVFDIVATFKMLAKFESSSEKSCEHKIIKMHLRYHLF